MIPTQPGVYLHKNKKNEIIYIGKAKNLKKRVQSYQRKQTHPKLQVLQKAITKTDYIITNNETEALLLENRLIKKHLPRYNVLLKDGKQYSYIKLTKENFPKIITTRRKNKKDTFFGPYTSTVKHTVHTINQVFQLRTCQTLPKQVCLNYHLKLCTGPCEKKVTKREYLQQVSNAKELLKGKVDKHIKAFKKDMQKHAKRKEYELAKDARDRMFALEKLKQQQNVELERTYNQDVIAQITENNKTAITLINIKKGVILKKQDFIFDTEENILDNFIKLYYSQNSLPREIIIQEIKDKKIKSYLEKLKGQELTITLPERGHKVKLLELAKTNAYAQFDTEDKILIELKEKLNMDTTPRIIECFDISNLGESNIVGSCIQFKDRKPNFAAYAHYNIKGNFGQDDFRSMHEVVKRRYSRFPLPDIIIIDGGHIQLDFALKAIKELNLIPPIIFGLAKKEETLIFPDKKEKKLNKRLASSKLLIQIRDATHRHVINFYRKKHKKSYKKSELDQIPGIGEKTKFKLLKRFKSVQAIKQASTKELEQVVNKRLAKAIKANVKE